LFRDFNRLVWVSDRRGVLLVVFLSDKFCGSTDYWLRSPPAGNYVRIGRLRSRRYYLMLSVCIAKAAAAVRFSTPNLA